jgi:hypothetical protein
MGDIETSKNEVLRYLGCKNQNMDEKINNLIEECILEIKKIAEEKYIYNYFRITSREFDVSLEDGLIEFQGKGIARHLKNSEGCYLMAVTLGNQVDTKIRYYEKTDMTRALILDACATAYVEEVCDRVCSIMGKEDKLKGRSLTYRFSPGYGDLSLDIQKSFLRVLDGQKKIGLTASSDNILLPRKSVTAVVGILKDSCSAGVKGCSSCNKNNDCRYKKEGGK